MDPLIHPLFAWCRVGFVLSWDHPPVPSTRARGRCVSGYGTPLLLGRVPHSPEYSSEMHSKLISTQNITTKGFSRCPFNINNSLLFL